MVLYEQLAESHGVIVRFRGKELGCVGCLRITVGTAGEITRFLRDTREVLIKLLQDDAELSESTTGVGQERDANNMIA